MDNTKYDLTTISNTTDALVVFGGDNVSKILADLEGEVRSVVPDLSTAKGRKEIASLAYKVSQSKTALDGLGKNLVADWKEKAKAVDSERKEIRDRLDALRDDIKAPLVEWQRVEDEKVAIAELEKAVLEAHEIALPENDLFDREREMARKEAEAEIAAEAQRQQEESKRVESERAERESTLVKEAEERAIKQAEENALLEKERNRLQIAEAKASEERAIRDKEDAARAFEERRILDIKQAEDRVRQEAYDSEQARLLAVKQEAERAELKAADKNHRAGINNEILASLVNIGASEALAKTIITSSAKGLINHLTINY
jgi:colicin import membrane protein